MYCFFHMVPESVWAKGSSNSGSLSYIFTSSHLRISSSHLRIDHIILKSSHLLILTSTHIIVTSSHLLIFTSTHIIFTFPHLHIIFTFSHIHISSSHLHKSTHVIFTSWHLPIFTPTHIILISSHLLSLSLALALAPVLLSEWCVRFGAGMLVPLQGSAVLLSGWFAALRQVCWCCCRVPLQGAAAGCRCRVLFQCDVKVACAL